VILYRPTEVLKKPSSFEVIKKHRSTPLLGHIPHAASCIPVGLRYSFVLNDENLAKELVRMTDAYTDELFAGIGDVGGVMIINRLSRLVMDPERFADDSEEIMSQKGMGAVYTKTSDGADLRRFLTASDRAAIIEKYYKPYHERLSSETAELIKAFGGCFIVDGHSFPSKPLPYELNQNKQRPDICIGTDAYHTPGLLEDVSLRYFQKKGLDVKVNEPFSGSLVPNRFYKNEKKVRTIMIEINRRLYMNEENGNKSPLFEQTKKMVDEYIRELSGHCLCG
jgi:N-formylglutamate amidohydrolase